MNTHWSWMPKYRVMADQPGRHDVALLVFADGKRIGMFPVTEYERLRVDLRQFAEVAEVQVKLLPVTGDELLGFMGMTRAEGSAGMPTAQDAWDRHLAVEACTEALLKCDHSDVRKDAYDLLVSLGAISQ